MRFKRRTRRLRSLVMLLLKQGVSRERIAWAVALGVTVAICPLIGFHTFLLTVIALRFRLNLPLIQLVNYLSWPLQILLFVPFLQAGDLLWRAPRIPLSAERITTMFREDHWGFTRQFLGSVLRGSSLWLVLSPLIVWVLYRLALGLLPRGRQRRTGKNPKKQPS